jgi:hypothetical protein
MAVRNPDKFPTTPEYYYDTHPTHEDLMDDSLPPEIFPMCTEPHKGLNPLTKFFQIQ